jgi:uncharacterized membrane protein
MNKTIKILIICSVLINILLIGVIFGHVSHRVTGKRFIRRQAPEFTVKLPADKKELFFETMKKVHLDNRDIHRKIRGEREKTISILTAPVFDETAYQTQVKKVHELRGFMMQRLADATEDLANQFTQEERVALAEHLRHPPRPPRGERPFYRERPPIR